LTHAIIQEKEERHRFPALFGYPASSRALRRAFKDIPVYLREIFKSMPSFQVPAAAAAFFSHWREKRRIENAAFCNSRSEHQIGQKLGKFDFFLMVPLNKSLIKNYNYSILM